MTDPQNPTLLTVPDPRSSSAPSELPTGFAPDLEVVRLLAEGSVARVYLAREPALKRLVAIKMLRPELAGNEVSRLRFEREAQAAAGIRHPNVISIHRVGRLENGLPYIVMEHVEGRNLEHLLQANGAMGMAEARRVLAGVAHALAAAHRKGVVHRDVHASNVVIENESDRVVLLDFGLAGILESGANPCNRLTRAGERLGDPRYASPEQLRGEPATPQSDVYGLGILAYELLAGSTPFQQRSTTELMQAKLAHDPPSLDEMRAGLDRDLVEIAQRCLRREAEYRPSAREVAEQLVRAAAPASSAALPASPTPHDGGLADLLGLGDFLRELRRRRVYRAAGAYVLGGIVVLEGSQLVLQGLPIHTVDALYQIVLATVLAGFPVALTLSWLFDVSEEGIVRDPGSSGGAWKARTLLPLAGLGFSILLAGTLWFLLLSGG